MSAAKRGLGRGLDALLGQPKADADEGYREIRVDAVRPNPQQPRQAFAPEALADLERSIRQLGVLVPIIVRPIATAGAAAAYELIAGERRWRAAAAAQLPTIPAIVRDVDERASLEVAVVENLQREGLDPLEEAMGFQHLVDDYGFTHDHLAERIGKSRPTVANALRLLTLSDAIKARLRSGGISVGHARALLAVDPEHREALAERAERDGLTVRELERFGTHRRERGAKRVPAAKSPDLEAVESRLRYALGAAVAIAAGGKGGKLEIWYADDADLQRLIDLLAPEAS